MIPLPLEAVALGQQQKFHPINIYRDILPFTWIFNHISTTLRSNETNLDIS